MMNEEGNKIKIPWYRRNIRIGNYEDTEINPMLSNNNIKIPKPKPKAVRTPVRQPVAVTQPNPFYNPVFNPVYNPFPNPVYNPVPNPFPDHGFKFPYPVPIPERTPNNEKPFESPIPQQQPVFSQMVGTMIKPLLLLLMLRKAANKQIQVKVTDPIYNRMLKDPVLGLALRESEKANLDLKVAATYFANYDYSNFNADQMTKDLTKLFGAAAAVRLIVFFVGRKVLFKI